MHLISVKHMSMSNFWDIHKSFDLRDARVWRLCVQVILEDSSLSPVTLSSTVYNFSNSLLNISPNFFSPQFLSLLKNLSAVLLKTSSYSYFSPNQTHNLCIPIQSLQQCFLISQMMILSHDLIFFSIHISSYYQQKFHNL